MMDRKYISFVRDGLWIVTAIGAITGGVLIFPALMHAVQGGGFSVGDAPHMVISVAAAAIPYCLARAVSEFGN